MIQGNAVNLALDSSTGAIDAIVSSTNSTYQFTITACGAGSTDYNDCVVSNSINLDIIVRDNCNIHIQFSTWKASSVVQGELGNIVEVESSGTNYFGTSDPTFCFISSYSIEVLMGDESKIDLDGSNGKIDVTIVPQSLLFKITACGANSIATNDCVSSGTIVLEVIESRKDLLWF